MGREMTWETKVLGALQAEGQEEHFEKADFFLSDQLLKAILRV